MTTGDAVALACAACSLLGAAFFGAAQTALTRMTLPRARALGEGDRRAARLVALLRDPVRTLNVVALLVLVLQVAGAALITVVLARNLRGPLEDAAAVALSVAAAAGTLFILAEVAPRTLAQQRPESVALATAGWVRLFALPLAPVAAVLVRIGDLIAPGGRLPSGPFVSADDLRHMIDVAESDDVIESSERRMLRGVFDLGTTLVREIMVPRTDMVTVGPDASLSRVVDVILTEGHSRIPVEGADRDRIVGVVYAKDVLARLRTAGHTGGDWHGLLREPLVVPELATVDHLLRDMQAQQVHLAIVVDEYGGVAGLVTIEDVLEEIVGEIVDEYDTEEPLVTPLGNGRWRVDARLPVDELGELVGVDLPDEEWDSVGGLCSGTLGRVPAQGESVVVAKGDSAAVPPVRLTVERVTDRRIRTVLVERLAPAAVGGGDGSGDAGSGDAGAAVADGATAADGAGRGRS